MQKIFFTLILFVSTSLGLQAQDLIPFEGKTAEGSHAYGYKDSQGNVVIAPAFKHAYKFSEGMAAVENIGGYVGYINTKGEIVIPIQYEDGSLFMQGAAAVKLNDKSGLIDKTGKAITEFKYDNIWDNHQTELPNGIFCAFINNKWGMLNAQGKEITPLHFEYPIYVFNEGKMKTKLNGKEIYIDKDGKVIEEGSGENDKYVQHTQTTATEKYLGCMLLNTTVVYTPYLYIVPVYGTATGDLDILAKKISEREGLTTQYYKEWVTGKTYQQIEKERTHRMITIKTATPYHIK